MSGAEQGKKQKKSKVVDEEEKEESESKSNASDHDDSSSSESSEAKSSSSSSSSKKNVPQSDQNGEESIETAASEDEDLSGDLERDLERPLDHDGKHDSDASDDDDDDNDEKNDPKHAAASSTTATAAPAASEAQATSKLLRSGSVKMKAKVVNVSKSDEKYCTDLLAKVLDAPRLLQWVSKINERGVVQQRLICVGKYRLYSIKKSKILGKHSIAREGHFFDLEEVVSKHADQVLLKFTKEENRVKFVIDIEGAGIGTVIANSINEAFAEYSLNFPPRYRPKFDVEPELKAAPAPSDKMAGGFLQTYKAFCNYYGLPRAEDLMAWVESLVSRGITELNLDQFGGNYRLKPVASALKHNRYFTSLRLADVSRETAVQAAAVTFIKNQTIQRIVVRNVDAKYDGFDAFGRVMRGNVRMSVTHLDLSHAQMEDRGATEFASGLAAYTKQMSELRLSHMSITMAGAEALLEGILKNEKGAFVALNLLDLSSNPLTGAAGTKLIEWLRKRRQVTDKPFSLFVGDSGVDVVPLFNGLVGVPLRELDVSGVALSAAALKALASLIAESAMLRKLTLARTSLTAAQAHEVVTALNGGSCTAVVLDLSGNKAVASECAELCKAIESGRGRVSGLRLVDCDIGDTDLAALFKALGDGQLHLAELALSLAFDAPAAGAPMSASGMLTPSSRGTSSRVAKVVSGAPAPAPPMAGDRVASLVAALKGAARLRRLAINGNTPLGSAMHALLEALPELPQLTALDIVGQQCGDRGVELVGVALRRPSVALRSISLDRNNVSEIGYSKLRDGVRDSKTLTSFVLPRADLRVLYDVALAAKGATAAKHEAIRDVQEDIEVHCAKNAATVAAEKSDEEENGVFFTAKVEKAKKETASKSGKSKKDKKADDEDDNDGGSANEDDLDDEAKTKTKKKDKKDGKKK